MITDLINKTKRYVKKPISKDYLKWIAIGLVAYMPFSLFLGRWLSLYTGGLAQWDASKDMFTVIGLLIAIYISVKEKLLSNKYVKTIFILASAYFVLHLSFIIFDKDDQDFRSLILGTLYNGRIFAYLFIGTVAGFVLSPKSQKTILRVLLLASSLTAILAIAQYFLPKDILVDFGYSIERGVKPNFFIDDKPDLPRVMSTIRDPNSYGAYLLLPLTLLGGLLVKGRKRFALIILLLLHFIALIMTFSRGAWIGFVFAALVFVVLYNKEAIIRNQKTIITASAVLLLIGAFVTYSIKDTYLFENIVLHSDESTVLADPNELRIQFYKDAIDGIAQNPEGYGPGTAGLVAIGNPKGGRLTENYYLQIGYEVGLLGLALFIVMAALTYRAILFLRDKDILGISLIATFWAYAFIATLIHLWSNEAVAVQWWLVSGHYIGSRFSMADKTKQIYFSKRLLYRGK